MFVTFRAYQRNEYSKYTACTGYNHHALESRYRHQEQNERECAQNHYNASETDILSCLGVRIPVAVFDFLGACLLLSAACRPPAAGVQNATANAQL